MDITVIKTEGFFFSFFSFFFGLGKWDWEKQFVPANHQTPFLSLWTHSCQTTSLSLFSWQRAAMWLSPSQWNAGRNEGHHSYLQSIKTLLWDPSCSPPFHISLPTSTANLETTFEGEKMTNGKGPDSALPTVQCKSCLDGEHLRCYGNKKLDCVEPLRFGAQLVTRASITSTNIYFYITSIPNRFTIMIAPARQWCYVGGGPGLQRWTAVVLPSFGAQAAPLPKNWLTSPSPWIWVVLWLLFPTGYSGDSEPLPSLTPRNPNTAIR